MGRISTPQFDKLAPEIDQIGESSTEPGQVPATFGRSSPTTARIARHTQSDADLEGQCRRDGRWPRAVESSPGPVQVRRSAGGRIWSSLDQHRPSVGGIDESWPRLAESGRDPLSKQARPDLGRCRPSSCPQVRNRQALGGFRPNLARVRPKLAK